MKVDTKAILAMYTEVQIKEAKDVVDIWWTNTETRIGYGYETAIIDQIGAMGMWPTQKERDLRYKIEEKGW